MSWEALTLRPRLVVAFLLAAGFGLLLPNTLPIWSKGLIAWCVGIVIYMALVIWQFSRLSMKDIRDMASRLDDSAPVILVIAMGATAASFGAIAALLLAPSTSLKSVDIVLAGCTMVLSWAFIQIVFAIHYTHIFYGDVNGNTRGGLEFGGKDDEPDFWDFLYFTTSIGATAQTSDTLVTTKTMRRIVLAQSIYAFFFNTAVLALAINIAASLAGH
jgi:uncharacterized membrane protein